MAVKETFLFYTLEAHVLSILMGEMVTLPLVEKDLKVMWFVRMKMEK